MLDISGQNCSLISFITTAWKLPTIKGQTSQSCRLPLVYIKFYDKLNLEIAHTALGYT